jgi:hypothetical protein
MLRVQATADLRHVLRQEAEGVSIRVDDIRPWALLRVS